MRKEDIDDDLNDRTNSSVKSKQDSLFFTTIKTSLTTHVEPL